MKNWRALALAIVLLGIATAAVVPFVSRGTRSVRMLLDSARGVSTQFDRKQSAALFVGVRQFSDNSVEEVPFAVDDAVDLAYVFALEPRVNLVPPRRVVLVLSGQPVKAESKDRLRALRDAGADVRYRAGAADISAALRDQSALAGRDGLLVVSLATHGFLRDGAACILGASSVVREPSTMLSTAGLFETIASSSAQRSLVFVDACRERLQQGTRSVQASAMSAAPLVGRRSRAHGQVVFYAAAAGQWAYDDFEARNGVFTKAVIDGINCGAAKVRGAVTAETLARYIEMNVSAWIRVNRDPKIGSATQFDMDGAARNLPLSQCWSAPSHCPAHVAAAATTVRAFSDKNELLWQRDAGSDVRRAEVVDLDADSKCEVVFATRDAIAALDESGNRLWTAREGMHLTAYVTGDLFRQHTNQVLALWIDERSPASRLAIYREDGTRFAAFDDARRVDLIAIARPSKRHKPKIVATSGNTVLVFDPKKLAAGKPLWSGRVVRAGPIASLEIVDGDGDGKSDIALTTASGAKIFVDFDGHAVAARPGARFERLAPKRRWH